MKEKNFSSTMGHACLIRHFEDPIASQKIITPDNGRDERVSQTRTISQMLMYGMTSFYRKP